METRSNRNPGCRPQETPRLLGRGANLPGLVLVGLAVIGFLCIAILALARSFGGGEQRSPDSVSASPAASKTAPGSNMAQSPLRLPFKVEVEIVPLDIFCKTALARTKEETVPLPTVDLPGVLQTLYAKRFVALESAFVDCQKAYEEGRITDAEMDSAHWIFSNSDPRIDPLLTGWIGLYPKTPFSWLARARHRRSLAEHTRGTKWAKDTPGINFQKMNYLLAMARQDYVQALDINPRLPFAYKGMMEAAGKTGDQGFVRALFAKGLQNNPGTVILWETMLYTSQPKWGGSLEEMDKVLAAASRNLKNPEDLREIKAIYYEYKGDHARQVEKDETAAGIFYDKMFEHLDPSAQYQKLGEKQKTWKEALSYYQKALSLDPFSIKTLRRHSLALLRMQQAEKALVYADVAVFLDAMEPYALRLRGEVHEKMGNFDLAIEDYKNSLTYDPEDSFANMHLGHFLDAIKGRPEEAAPYLMQALLSDPQNASVLYTLGLNEETRKDCNALKSAAAFLNACNQGNVICSPRGLQWARTVGKRMGSAGLCR